MASRTLVLALISAQDLKDVNLFSKMVVYAVATFSDDHRSSQRTPADYHGGKNPAWNTTLRFALPPTGDLSRHTLHVILRSERPLGDRDVGEVHIPLKELLDGPAAGKGPSTFVSYQVCNPSSGKAMGVLNISYKFVDTAPPAADPPPAAYPATAPAKYDEPAKAYPPGPVAAYPVPGYTNPEPVAAYRAGPSTTYAPPQAAPYANPYPPQGYPGPAPAGYGYPPPPQAGYGYGPPPQAGYGPPPQAGYGCPQAGYGCPQAGYGWGYGYPPAGYGYPPAGYAAPPMAAQRPKKNKLGMRLLVEAIGGLLLGVGDVVSDIGQLGVGHVVSDIGHVVSDIGQLGVGQLGVGHVLSDIGHVVSDIGQLGVGEVVSDIGQDDYDAVYDAGYDDGGFGF